MSSCRSPHGSSVTKPAHVREQVAYRDFWTVAGRIPVSFAQLRDVALSGRIEREAYRRHAACRAASAEKFLDMDAIRNTVSGVTGPSSSRYPGHRTRVHTRACRPPPHRTPAQARGCPDIISRRSGSRLASTSGRLAAGLRGHGGRERDAEGQGDDKIPGLHRIRPAGVMSHRGMGGAARWNTGLMARPDWMRDTPGMRVRTSSMKRW